MGGDRVERVPGADSERQRGALGWPRGPRAWALLAILAGLVVLLAISSFRRQAAPQIEVPVPGDLERMEPQLRAYVSNKVQWVKAAPGDARRQATLGMVYAANSLWAEARVAFQNVVRLSPREPLGHLYAAIATQEMGDLSDAVRQYRQIVQRFPDFPQGHCRLGEALLRSGANEEAAACYARLRTLAPQEWRGLSGLAQVKLRQNNPAEAARLAEQALQSAPREKTLHHLLGLAYRGLGRQEDAQRELSLGTDALHYPMPDPWLQTAPQHMKLLPDLFELADDAIAVRHPGKAIGILEEALTYNPANLSVMDHLAIAYNSAGQFSQARSLLLRELELNQRHVPAHLTLSATLLALQRFDEALAHAESAIQLAPNMAQPYEAKANVLLAQEKDEDALVPLLAALRCDPKNLQLRLEIGDVYLLNLKRSDEALAQYQEVSRLDPGCADAFARLANFYLSHKRTNEARQAVETLRKLAPTEPSVAKLEAWLKRLEGR